MGIYVCHAHLSDLVVHVLSRENDIQVTKMLPGHFACEVWTDVEKRTPCTRLVYAKVSW